MKNLIRVKLKEVRWGWKTNVAYLAKPVKHQGEDRYEVYFPGSPVTLLTTSDNVEVVA